MIRQYMYWIAASNRAYGEGDAQRIEALRSLWQSQRLIDAVSPFEGASFWLADGQPHARIIRAVHPGAMHPVEVVDVDPAIIAAGGR